MNQSENINELATALCNAQAEMRGAVKDSRNPFFKSKYADLVSVMKAIKDSFQKHGLSFTQFPHSENGCVGVMTTLMHVSGQYQQHSFALPLSKKDPQAAGAAITYAKRYALQGIAGIPSEDDDAESAMNRQPNRNAPPAVDYVSQLNSSKTLQAFEIIVNQMKEKGVKIRGNEALSNAYVANKARFEENKTH